MTKALGDLPSDLNETYYRILKKIHPLQREKICSVLKWLAFSRRPLLLKELLEAAAIDPKHRFDVNNRIQHLQSIPDSCSSLVTITSGGKEETIRFAHPSVQRYLDSKRLQAIGPPASTFEFSEIDAHSFIAECSLQYLLSFDRRDSLSKADLDAFPLLEYAADFWIAHVKYLESESNISPSTVTLAGAVLNPAKTAGFLNWIRFQDPDGYRRRRFNLQLEQIQESTLYLAAREGLQKVSEELLEMGADVNAQGGHYGNALQAASYNGHDQIVQRLLDKGADVNAQGGLYGNALQAASDNGHDQIVQRLKSAIQSQ